MFGKLAGLLKSQKSGRNTLRIYRVSDLLARGFDADKLTGEFVRLNQEVWGEITDQRYLWTIGMVKSHFRICPELIYCAFENGRMTASLTCMAITEEDMQKNKTWLAKTGDGYLTTHRPDGNIGFGVDLTVSRNASRGVSNKIVFSALLVSLLGNGMKAVYLGARIPSYHKYHPMPVENYVFGTRRNGKPLDPELYFYLKQGFKIVEIIPEYMEDPDSLNYGVLIRWGNPIYKLTMTMSFLKPVMRIIGKLIC